MRASSLSLSVAALFFVACSGAIEYPDDSEFEPGLPPAEPEPETATDPPPQSSEPGQNQGDVAVLPQDGAGLYQSVCAVCHGDEGTGTDVAPEIQHPPPDYFEWVVRNGLEGAYDSPMLAFSEASLSDAQIDRILEYLTELPQPTTDEGLYFDYCANCHGDDARGGVANKKIAGKDEFLEVLRQGKGGANYQARTRYMPSWQSSELDDALVSRLEGYVGELPE